MRSLILLNSLLFLSLNAATIDFLGPAGDWSIGTSWNGGSSPNSSDLANFPAAGSWTVSVNQGVPVAGSVNFSGTTTAQFLSGTALQLGDGSSAAISNNGSVTLTGGGSNSGVVFVNSGTLFLNSSTLTINNGAYISGSSSSPLELDITGPGALTIGPGSIGFNTPYKFDNIAILSGNYNVLGAGVLGQYGSIYSGSMSIQNGTFSVNGGYIGNASQNAVLDFIISGGNFNGTGSSFIGAFSGSSTGTVSVDDAIFSINSFTTLGYGSGSSTVNVAILGGTFSGLNEPNIGYAVDDARLNLDIQDGNYNGGVKFFRIGYLKNNAVGSVSIDGGTFILNEGRICHTQDNAKLNLKISSGTFTGINSNRIGYLYNNAIGSMTISDGSFFNNSSYIASVSGDAKLNLDITGGLFANSALAYLGYLYNNASVSMDIQDGVFNNNSSYIGYVRDNSTLNFNIDGGTFTGTFSYIGYLPATSMGTVNLAIAGGTFFSNQSQILTIQGTSNGVLNITGGSFTGTNTSLVGITFGSSTGSISITNGTFSHFGSRIADAEDQSILNLLIQNGNFNHQTMTTSYYAGIGYYFGSSQGSVTIQGGSFTNNNSRICNAQGTSQASLLITGGSFTGTNTSLVGITFGSSTGSISITNGTFSHFGSRIADAEDQSILNLLIQNGNFNHQTMTTSYYAGIGYYFGSSQGSVTIQGGSFTNNNSRILDVEGTSQASLLITGGSFTGTNSSFLGAFFENAKGTVTLENGFFSNNNSRICFALGTSQASLKITGGNFISSATSTIGFFENQSIGTVTIEGGTFSNNNSRICNAQGTSQASLKITGGNFISSATSNIGFFSAQALGTVTIESGLFTTSNNSRIGQIQDTCTAYVAISGGTFDQGNQSRIIRVANNATATCVISSGAFTSTNSYVADCGFTSKLNLTISGGSFTGTSNSFIGRFLDQSTGTITISGGTFNDSNSTIGFTSSTASLRFNLQGGSISSVNGTMMCRGSLSSSVDFLMSGGTIISNNTSLGYNSNTITLNGGFLNLQNSRLAPFVASSFSISGTANLKTDPLTYTGPAPLTMTGGTFLNFGTLILDKVCFNSSALYARQSSLSNLTNGAISGSGSLWIAGDATITNSITQGTVTVGQGIIVTNPPSGYTPQNVISKLVFAGSMSANTIVTGSASMYGFGTCTGDVTINTSGLLTPGGLVDQTDIFKIRGNLNMDSASILRIDFDQNGSDQVIIYGGNLNLASVPSKPILLLKAVGPITSSGLVPIVRLETASNLGLYNGVINGSFEIQGDQPLISFNLIQAPNGLFLQVIPNSFVSQAVTKNQKSVAATLDALNGNTNACLQEKINQMQLFTAPLLNQALNSLDPSEFKAQQLVLEELSFIMNNDLSHLLYSPHLGFRGFLTGGYENLSQDSYSQYQGFSSDTGYELIGLSYGFEKWQMLGALGALETATEYKLIPSHSSSSSIIANFGASGFMKRYHFGIDALFGYHFIHTSRKIEPFHLKATSNHGGYNIKIEAKAGYTKLWKNTNFIPYEQFAYNYIHENDFHETGASCLNLHVNASSQSMIRNTFGIRIEGLVEKPKTRIIHIKPYIDGSWVYENRFKGKDYSAQFQNTQPSMHVEGIDLTRNFGKLELGLLGSGEFYSIRASFNGMWGQRISELGASLSFDRKF